MPAPNTANRDQAALWNESSGPAWAALQDTLDRMLAPFVDILLEHAFTGEGRQVLDIGCGAGATTRAMARRLGPDGLALGVDISAPLVAAARARTAEEGVTSAAFVEGDAQTFAFDRAAFDAVMSRFGVMFFEDPEAAFANIRGAARRDARLAFVAWRSPAENPFMTVPLRAAGHLLPPIPRPEPNAPGQYGFADGERVQRILDANGWREVKVEPIDVACEITESDLFAYITRLGPVGAVLREMDEPRRREITDVIRPAYAPYMHEGLARFTSACWLATARA